MYKSIFILSTIVGLALNTAPLQAQVIDCASQSADLEPAGYAAQCGPFNTAPGPQVANPRAPTDMGTAITLRADALPLPVSTLLNFTINDFPGMTAGAATNPSLFALDYDETGTIIYGIPASTATANANTLISIDPTTGVATPIAALTGAAGANGLTIDPTTGDAYIVDATNLYSLDLTTAVATLIGVTDGAAIMIDVAMNCEGQIYAHDILSDSLFSIDPVTGAGTNVGATGFDANFAQGMDFDNDDGTLYGFIYTGGGTNTFGSFDLTTGAVTALATNDPLGEFEGAFPGTCEQVQQPLPVSQPVPTLGQFGLLLLCLILAGVGVVVIRRQRSSQLR